MASTAHGSFSACGRALVAVAAALSLPLAGCAKQKVATTAGDAIVNFANWFDYIAPDALPAFTRETGVKVNYDLYDTNETLEAKLIVGHSGYDLVVPSYTNFFRQRQAGVFQKLDRSKLGNARGLDREILAKLAEVVDPGNAYAIPYSWGTTGIGFDVDRIRERMPDAPLDSWALIFDPAIAARFRDCGIAMVDAPADVVQSALIYLGRDPGSQTEADLHDAIDVVARIRPFVRYFHGSQWTDDLANGEICLALGWSGSFFKSMHSSPRLNLRYVIPREGALLWIDVLAIPADAAHVDDAHRLIDLLLRPEIASAFTNTNFYPSAVTKAIDGVEPAIRAEPAIYPPAALRDRLHLTAPESPQYERQRLRLWMSMKAGE